MIVLYIYLVAFAAAKETTQANPNDITGTKPAISYELEDLSDYNEDPNYPWPMFRRILSGLGDYNDNKVGRSSSSFEDVSRKSVRSRSDLEAYPEGSYSDTVDDYDDDIAEEPTRRVGSPLELLGHFISGKKKILNGINEGVLGGKTVLEGIHEITKVLGGFLAAI